MRGTNHIITNTSILFASLSFSQYMPIMVDRMIPANPDCLTGLLYPAAGYLSFVVGSLLPDIDTKHSLLGRYIHIPVAHRTWTHTLWVILLFFFLGIKSRLLFWMFLGVTLHIFIDALSAGGVSYLYPITKYRVYNNAKIAEHHAFKIYKVGSSSESNFVFLIVSISILIFGYYGIWNKGILYFWM